MATKKNNELWLKAAIAGGLWAAVEIIIGSYLHNLRIPFAGSILASAGIMIMTGFFRLWPEKGLLIRTGLICALMKAVSPSAIILGPMIGIMMEAFLMETGIRLFGKSFIAMAIAGIISVSSALFHKLFSLFLLFGLDIFKIYINFYEFIAKQSGLGEISIWYLAGLILFIYVTAGATSVYLGYHAARLAIDPAFIKSRISLKLKLQEGSFMNIDPNKNHSIFWLFIHFIALIGILILLNKIENIFIHILPFAYLVWVGIEYKSFLRRLSKPVFWTQLILIPLFSLVFLGDISQFPDNISINNLLQGIYMDERALLVVAAFSAISAELRNPTVKSIMLNSRNRELYKALQYAFSALPLMIDASGKVKELLLHPIHFVANILYQAQIWHTKQQNSNENFNL